MVQLNLNKKHINEIKDKFFKIPDLKFYDMHYWYFNHIDLKTDEAYSIIFAKSNKPTKLNNKKYVFKTKNEYLLALINFNKQKMKLTKQKITIKNNNELKTKNFQFELKNKEIRINMFGKKFESKNFQKDTFHSKRKALYDLVNTNAYTKDKKSFLCAQNVLKRGPLIPWHWLHLYLNDGTYLKIFNVMGTNKKIDINHKPFKITNVTEEKNQIHYKTKKGKKYLNFTINKNKEYLLKYKPKLSTTWKYKQYSPTLEKIQTNMKNVNASTGRGILEIASGFSL